MQQTTYDRAGLTFDVTVSGPDDGAPVVLLHGFPADRTCWDRIAAHLVDAGLRTLAPDQRGYSPRARPTGRTAYALPHLVEDVVGLLDAFGIEQAHLVGHDWGGAVAWAAASAHPDRFATLTVLSTPHPTALKQAYRTWWQASHSLYMGYFQLPRVPELLFSRTFPRSLRGSGLPEVAVEHYLARMAEPGALTAALGWYRAIGHSGIRAGRIAVPTTLVWGRDDGFLGRDAAEGTAAMVRSDYRLVELDEGHWLPEVAAERCAEEILRRVRGDAGNS